MSRSPHLTFTRLAGASMVGALLVGAAPAADPLQADPLAVVDECMRQEVAAEGMPGAALAIGQGGRVVHTLALGVKHREQGGAVDDETLFQIGSITKMMTAAAVMQQVEAGAVDLDARVTTYIPELEVAGPWAANLITIRHLLTHTSGFPDNWGPLDGRSPREWVADARRLSLEAAPGSFFNYSNPGFSLAGHVVERATGADYTSYMRQRVWRPAGLELTTLDPDEVLAHRNWAYGHSRRGRVAPRDVRPPFAMP
ncbi:MAG: serine hydrolase domain-containing protein, partial [Anaerolineae bacterium]